MPPHQTLRLYAVDVVHHNGIQYWQMERNFKGGNEDECNGNKTKIETDGTVSGLG